MATNYIVPQVLVFQEFQLVPTSTLRPLPAHIAGPHAFLRRYAEDDERELAKLGFYDSVADHAYAFPGRPAGGLIDASYTKVFIKDALLRYFDDEVSAGSTITRTAGYNNRVRSDSISFAANGTPDANGDYPYPISAGLGDRGAKIGDVVRIRKGDTTLWTYVNGFLGDAVAAVTGAAAADADNEATQVASASVSQTDGPENCVTVGSANADAYDGLETGDIDETYTIEVVESSTDGDHTTAKLRVTSASGNDDVDDVSPSAGGAPTAIGARGATVVFNYAACDSEELTGAELGPADLLQGMVFELTVHQAFTKPTATAGGTYTGTKDLTYIVTVTKGGLYADSPEVTVTTDLGVDVSGPTIVTAAATAVSIGSKGVTMSWSGTALRAGDVYTVPVTAATTGAKKTILLGHNVPVEIEAGDEVSLELYIRKDLAVTADRTGEAPLTNWEQSDTEITLKSGITAYDDSYTVDGVLVGLEVFSASSPGYGTAYVEYRAWLSDLCHNVNSVSDVSALEAAISGPLHPDNPLKWGVYKALSNSNGQAVQFTSVCDPDSVDSWNDVLALLDGREDVYGLVPLTRNSTVLDLYAAHVDAQSSPEFGRWRVCWVNLPDVAEKTIVSADTSTDGAVVLAVLEDDIDTSGTQYTMLRVTSGNGNFITNGVRPNDVADYLFTTDGFGGESRTSFTVDQVISEDQVRLITGNATPVSTPQKVQIRRTLNKTDRSQAIADIAGHYTSRRVRAVWPDVVTSGGYSTPGYFLCAALAGLSSGVVSHQGLTNLAVTGFDDMKRTVDLFNRTQLNVMAGAGAWIVTEDPNTGTVFTRHAVTTGSTADINEREEMVVRNVDAISYLFQDRLKPFIGISNAVPDFLDVIRVETDSMIMFLRGNNFVKRLGSQLVAGEIKDLRLHTLLRDRVVLVLSLTIPYPANNVEVHLVVG